MADATCVLSWNTAATGTVSALLAGALQCWRGRCTLGKMAMMTTCVLGSFVRRKSRMSWYSSATLTPRSAVQFPTMSAPPDAPTMAKADREIFALDTECSACMCVRSVCRCLTVCPCMQDDDLGVVRLVSGQLPMPEPPCHVLHLVVCQEPQGLFSGLQQSSLTAGASWLA